MQLECVVGEGDEVESIQVSGDDEGDSKEEPSLGLSVPSDEQQ
jgi:hypothetical protein